MKYELIVEGVTKEEFLEVATLSTECKVFHDGKVHALYELKKYAEEDRRAIKCAYTRSCSTITTNLSCWRFFKLNNTKTN